MEVSASLKKVETYFEGFYTPSVSPRFVSRINLLYNLNATIEIILLIRWLLTTTPTPTMSGFDKISKLY